METSKFSLICHGKRRETLSSNTIMQLFPKFESLTKIPGEGHDARPKLTIGMLRAH